MRERGRENGSFSVAEVLKPLGFKESDLAERRINMSNDADVS